MRGFSAPFSKATVKSWRNYLKRTGGGKIASTVRKNLIAACAEIAFTGSYNFKKEKNK